MQRVEPERLFCTSDLAITILDRIFIVTLQNININNNSNREIMTFSELPYSEIKST